MDIKEMQENVAILTPATPEQLADCCTEEEVMLVGTLAIRGFCAEIMNEILHEHRRLSAQIMMDTFSCWQEQSGELFSDR